MYVHIPTSLGPGEVGGEYPACGACCKEAWLAEAAREREDRREAVRCMSGLSDGSVPNE